MAGLNLWEIYATLGVDTSQYDRDMDAAIAKAQTLNNTLNQAVGGGTTTGAGSSSTVPASTKGSWQDTTTGILMAEAVKKGAEWGWKLTKESINLASAKQEVQNVVDTTFGTYSDALDNGRPGQRNPSAWVRSLQSSTRACLVICLPQQALQGMSCIPCPPA